MIKSMTGFASLTREDDRVTLTVSVKAVNHRFLDVQLRLPPMLPGLEPRVRGVLQRRMSRGRVELAVACQLRAPAIPSVELNQAFAQALTIALDQARDRGLIVGTLTPGDLLRLPQAITVRERPVELTAEEESQLLDVLESAVDEALVELDTMRSREGQHLRTDLDTRRTLLGEMVERVNAAADEGRAALAARVRDRVGELTADLSVDATLIAQEVVRLAARSDISEEVTRFRGHLAHWQALSDSDEPCGRKLDFLLQEMNREVNTIGSKADGLRVSEIVIGAKAELEKMREQVQNVE